MKSTIPLFATLSLTLAACSQTGNLPQALDTAADTSLSVQALGGSLSGSISKPFFTGPAFVYLCRSTKLGCTRSEVVALTRVTINEASGNARYTLSNVPQGSYYVYGVLDTDKNGVLSPLELYPTDFQNGAPNIFTIYQQGEKGVISVRPPATGVNLLLGF
ncbi:hypothetical protein [Deinococcus sp.]|uniref:hypothetical protein n=1 Tax=Deinococcus sp. TaxID=47478 RepID=UPI003C7C692B